MTEILVPLKNLRFGHEAPDAVNARVVGREDDIATLAANIYERGQIEALVVKDSGDGEIFYVSNGNRRLAALHMIYGKESAQLIECKPRDVDIAGAFEDSLTTAVLAHQLHPVDQYEAFARLQSNGRTQDEIARVFGLTGRQVEQALALGQLSPAVRESWRRSEISADVAKAFTLAVDHKQQDEVLEQLRADSSEMADLDDSDVKRILKVGQDNAGRLVEFVGIAAFEARGGRVIRDLFGTDHKVSDAKLAKTMAAEKLAEECKVLKSAGWGFAVTKESVRNNEWKYERAKVTSAATPEEVARIAELQAMIDQEDAASGRAQWNKLPFAERSPRTRQAIIELRDLDRAVKLRVYTPALMAKCGCFVGIDDDGMLEVDYGRIKPEQKEAAKEEAKTARKTTKKAAETAAIAEGKPAPEPTEISNALAERLGRSLVAATREALVNDTVQSHPLQAALVKIVCSQIDPDRPWGMPSEVRNKLPQIREALTPAVFNEAMLKHFDAADYFGSAPRGFVIKAIAEAINPDEARKLKGKSKADTAKFAIANLAKSGWLPKELRTPHYAPPKVAPAAPAPNEPAAKTAKPAPKTKAPAPAKTAARKVPKTVAKPAAKKAAKKTPAKKRKAA